MENKYSIRNLAKKLGTGLLIPVTLATTLAVSKPKTVNADDINLEAKINQEVYSSLTYNNSNRDSVKQDYTKFGVEVSPESIKLRYTSNNLREFLWGVTRFLHPYNKHPDNGKIEILPFYTRAFKPGGFLSPLILKNWKKDFPLTLGVLAQELGTGIAVYKIVQDNKDSTQTPPQIDNNPDNTNGGGDNPPSEQPPQEEPLPPSPGDGDGNGDGGSGGDL